jgi:hypothetical protein
MGHCTTGRRVADKRCGRLPSSALERSAWAGDRHRSPWKNRPEHSGRNGEQETQNGGERTLKAHTESKAQAPIYEEIDPEHFVDSDQEPVPEFPLDTLPDIFRKPVEEVMRHYRVSALLPATCALVINSVALGRGVVTKSNVRRTYGNLYAIIGAQSGSGKTPPFDEFMAPLMKLQKESMDEFKTNQKPRAEADLKLLERQIQTLVKQGQDPDKFNIAEDCRHEKLAELLQQKAELEDKLQYASRLWTEDFTSEALGVLLANNREQMAILTDDGGLVILICWDGIPTAMLKTISCCAKQRLSAPSRWIAWGANRFCCTSPA